MQPFIALTSTQPTSAGCTHIFLKMRKPKEYPVEESTRSPSKYIIPTLDRRRIIYKKLGWLYILRNEGIGRNLLKIGMSSRFPEQRSRELSQSTSVPTPFELIYYVHVGDRYQAERFAHQMLIDYRKTSGKEFFIAPISEAIKALDQAAGHFPVYITTPKGRVKGILQQDILPKLCPCQNCGKRVRLRRLWIPTIQRCGNCGEVMLDETR